MLAKRRFLKTSKLSIQLWLGIFNPKLDAFSKYMTTSWIGIAVYCLFSFLFSCVILILLRFIPQATVWVIPILLTALLLLISFASTLFAFDSSSDGTESSLFLYVGFYVFLMLVFVKKIILVAKIFGETAKSMIHVPSIAILPILPW